jgi:hypothetical protein
LEQLSTGTRIQLLLAVRLAFIETQEQSLKLPILADELLANSDESRAEAIIKALVQMSQEGRQVFYFTAQADEVFKWKSYLQQRDLGYQLHEIGQGTERGFAYYDSYRPPRKSLKLTARIPSPEQEDDHNSFGQKLEVPPFNLLIDPPGQIHLWYLIEDISILHQSLTRQIRFWGELHNFIHHGGDIEGMDDQKIDRLEDLVAWLTRFQELYRQGRSRPIDRSVLEETDAVTDNFIDDVDRLLNEVKGDPEQLLQGLQEGEVSGFRKSKLEELEIFLVEQGYVDESDPLSLEEIRTQLQAHLDQLSISADEAERLLDRVLQD